MKVISTKRFYRAYSRSLDACGHNHRTSKAAEPCLKKLKKAWTKWRSDISKRAAEQRRIARLNTPVLSRRTDGTWTIPV